MIVGQPKGVKQPIYNNFMEKYHRTAVEGTGKRLKAFAYWQIRCELVAPESVWDAIRPIVESNEDRAGREQADHDMEVAMRADLGITK